MSPQHDDNIVQDVDEIEDESGSDSDSDGGNTAGISFEPAETLPELHWHRRTIDDLYDMMNSPYLNLNPDYQRDVVWTPERMTKLINSLMSGYYVPPLIFNVNRVDTDDGERYYRISVDGKQRLTSIREFMAGRIPCTDRKGRRWYMVGDGGTTKKRLLSPKVRQRFGGLNLLCAEYMGLELKQEEDLFSRVQLGMPLTPAEKLKASSGRWQSFAIDIEKCYPSLLDVVDNRRARGFQLILQIFKQIVNAEEANPKYSAGAGALKGFVDKPQVLDEPMRCTARRVFSAYNEVLQKHPETFENQNYKHSAKFSPIEFVGAAVLIHRFPERNSKMLSGDILLMRAYLRKERQDLRSNTQTWRAIVSFINDIEKYRGGAGVIPLPSDRQLHAANVYERKAATVSATIGSGVHSSGVVGMQPPQLTSTVTTKREKVPPPRQLQQGAEPLIFASGSHNSILARGVREDSVMPDASDSPPSTTAPAPAPTPAPARLNMSSLNNLASNSFGSRFRAVPSNTPSAGPGPGESVGAGATKRRADGRETFGTKRERLG